MASLLIMLLVILSSADWLALTMTLTQYDRVSFGKSGRVCTKSKERCLSTAACCKQRCMCPQGTKGNGLVACVPQDHHLCTVTNHFELQGFGDSDDVTISYPCVTRLTAFAVVHPLKGHSCFFDVLGTPYPRSFANKVLGFVVRVKLHSANLDQLTLKVGASAKGFFQHVASFDRWGMRKAVKMGNSGWMGWGNSSSTQWNDFNILCTFDTVNNFAIFHIPQCRTKVKLRPADVLMSGNNGQVPAITIQAPPDASWECGLVPESRHSLCGTPDNKRYRWMTAAQQMRVGLKRLAALFDTLLQGPGISMFTSTYIACQAAPRTFSTCLGPSQLYGHLSAGPGQSYGGKFLYPTSQQPQNKALAVCGPLLTDSVIYYCLLNQVVGGSVPGVLFLFDQCLHLVCSAPDSQQRTVSCHVMRVLMHHLQPHAQCGSNNPMLSPLRNELNKGCTLVSDTYPKDSKVTGLFKNSPKTPRMRQFFPH